MKMIRTHTRSMPSYSNTRSLLFCSSNNLYVFMLNKFHEIIPMYLQNCNLGALYIDVNELIIDDLSAQNVDLATLV